MPPGAAACGALSIIALDMIAIMAVIGFIKNENVQPSAGQRGQSVS
jgi:hypothetical protein